MHQPLQEAFYETDRARLQRWIPWIHLFRAFRLSTRWQNLVLALAGVCLLSAGYWALSFLPFSAYERRSDTLVKLSLGSEDIASLNHRTRWPWESQFLDPRLPPAQARFNPSDLASPLTILSPWRDLVRSASVLFERRNSWSDIADAWLHVLLILAIGSLIGGAITRRVALEFGRSIEPGVRESLRFAIRDFPFYFGAPLISVIGVGVLLLLGRVIGWMGRVPGVGETIAAVAWGLLFLFSLVMALILLGVAVAWPLMVAAHSAEGTDGFDALNRAYNYVFVRPWYALWLVLVTLAYGAAIITFVLFLVGFTVHLSEWIAAGPLSDESLARITQAAPELVHSGNSQGAEPTIATDIGGLWQHGLASLLTAFVYSFFWTSATLIYLLLRQSNDAVELTRIYVPGEKACTDGPPLAGMAAVKNREQAAKAADPPAGDGDSADADPPTA